MAADNERTILHMDLDSFFVSVERLKNPELIGKPVIVGGSSKRGVVAACSYETRKYGVHSAMPMMQALKLCPDAIVISGSHGEYSVYSRQVTSIIREEAPLFEKSSIDEFYIDLTGMEKYFGCYQWATKLRHRIMAETNLPISFGLSVNKMIAKIATGEAKPNGQLMIPRGTEAEFIAPMKVGKIPFIGEKTEEMLNKLGIRTVGQLANYYPKHLEQFIGNHAHGLQQRARGIDHSPITPYHDAKSVSTERTFYEDTTDVNYLRSLLNAMVEKVAFELRDDHKLAACVTVKIRYHDFRTVSKQCMVDLTASDHIFAEKAHQLFNELWDHRTPIRLLGFRLGHLEHGKQQLDMFRDKPEQVKLYQALDKIKSLHGNNKIARASGIGHRIHDKDANPFSKE